MARRRRKSTSKHTPELYRRATYYLRPDQIRALKLRAASENRQLSGLMREAVDLYLRYPAARTSAVGDSRILGSEGGFRRAPPVRVLRRAPGRQPARRRGGSAAT